MTLNPRTRPPTTTHDIPGQSRRKHMDSSLTSLAKDGSTKKMKEVKASKKPVGYNALSLKLKDEKKMKRSSSQTTALLLPLRKTDSIRRSVQKSRKLVGATSQKKLHLLHDHHADSRSRKKDGNEEGDSRTAALMHHKRRREGGRRTEQMKKVGATLESQRRVSRGGCRISNSYINYKHKKLPPRPRPRPRGTVDFQSQTGSSYTITESINESASRTSSPSTLNQRTSEQPWMRKNSLIHYSRRKYYSSSSSSSSSSCWLVSRPASSLRSRPRAVREKPTDSRRGRLRRFKDKLAVIFHHHHHHYHLGGSGGDSEVESPTPPEDNSHRRGSIRKPSGAGSTSAVIRVPRHRHRHRHHGHLYTLLQRLLRHVWHSGMEEEGKTCSRLVGMGRNDRCVQQGAAGGGGGKQGSRKKKPAVGLGFSKAQRNKIQVS